MALHSSFTYSSTLFYPSFNLINYASSHVVSDLKIPYITFHLFFTNVCRLYVLNSATWRAVCVNTTFASFITSLRNDLFAIQEPYIGIISSYCFTHLGHTLYIFMISMYRGNIRVRVP